MLSAVKKVTNQENSPKDAENRSSPVPDQVLKTIRKTGLFYPSFVFGQASQPISFRSVAPKVQAPLAKKSGSSERVVEYTSLSLNSPH